MTHKHMEASKKGAEKEKNKNAHVYPRGFPPAGINKNMEKHRKWWKIMENQEETRIRGKTGKTMHNHNDMGFWQG